jgi:RNA polymerase sigma-70 factor (ECF subfamily)
LPLDPQAIELRAAHSDLTEEMIDHKRCLEQLSTCLDDMPRNLREAFVLFELEELNAPEVAKVLRVPVGTVASRVRRAREIIRKNLARRGIR